VRTRKPDKSFLMLILIVLVVAAAGVYGFLQFRTDALTDMVAHGSPVNILFIFARGEALDHMELLLYDPATKRGGLFHIPANLGLQIAELGRFDRISVLYAADNLEPLRRKTEQLVKAPIPFHIVLSYDHIANIVDLLGGIELFISNSIDSESGEVRTLLPSGSVTLDGDKALQYLEYADPLEDDMERVGRQQKFLQSLFRRIGQPATQDLLGDPAANALFKSYLQTNISSRGVDSLVRELGRLDPDHLVFQRVMGSLRQVEGVKGDVLLPHYEGALIRETLSQMSQAIRSQAPAATESVTVRIEILNGTGLDGLARRTKALYESFGFEVVSFGNADNDRYVNSVVLDRRGDMDAAKRAADIIHCDRVQAQPNASSDADVTVILGRDFDGRYVKQQ
jgi:anionic cell wall polymer biosynthesis LytR-Cps2A-Psr (LCP) family protein